MSKKYLVRIKPLEPYFFGDENSIRFDNSNSYFVSSLNTPSAMTIMGMLRYTLLEQNGLLKTDGIYTADQLSENAKLIGSTSFKPGDDVEYGAIKGVSPLFLMKGDDIYIKTPLNHKTSEAKYTAFKLGGSVSTSFGDIVMPLKNEFNAKSTVDDNSYTNICSGEIVCGLFRDFIKITNRKLSKENGFMKKVFKVLDKDFSFAITVELDENVKFNSSVCYMGREKSAFSLEVSDGFDVCEQIKEGYIGKNFEGFSYAFGDMVLKSAPKYKSLAFVNSKNLRHLTTSGKNTIICRSTVLHGVISAGSVIYLTDDIADGIDVLGNDKFGINKIISFGGKTK